MKTMVTLAQGTGFVRIPRTDLRKSATTLPQYNKTVRALTAGIVILLTGLFVFHSAQCAAMCSLQGCEHRSSPGAGCHKSKPPAPAKPGESKCWRTHAVTESWVKAGAFPATFVAGAAPVVPLAIPQPLHFPVVTTPDTSPPAQSVIILRI